MNNYNENKYSKQMYIYDEIYQNRINNTKIFISGLGGLGLEIAKNLILSGVQCVMLHDICDTTIYDLSSQYFLSNEDLKKNRAVMSRDKLSDLNKGLDNPKFEIEPNRLELFHWLSYCQYTLEEIKSGFAWKTINNFQD